MSRVTRRVGTKNREAKRLALVSYYKNFRNGKNRYNTK